MKIAPLKLWPSAILIALLLVLANPAQAFSLPNLLKPVEELIQKSPLAQVIPSEQQLTISSTITLAPDGDVNNNGEIDSGDIVRFSFMLTNTTDKAYSYSILKTNINRKQLNFIHTLRGATGLSDDDNTVIFRNIRLGPNDQRTISFDARVNYSEEDKIISSEPEFISSDEKLVGKFQKKEISAKKLSKEEIKKRHENRKQVIKKEIKK